MTEDFKDYIESKNVKYIDTDVKLTNELLEKAAEEYTQNEIRMSKEAVNKMFGISKLGMKHDEDKLMMNLIPPSVFESLGRILTYGAEKYAPNSWQHIENAEERYKAALLRHFVEYMKNPLSKDEESGMYHIEHVLCNAAFLNDFAMNNPDDRKYITKHIHQPELDKCVDCGEEYTDYHVCKNGYVCLTCGVRHSGEHVCNVIEPEKIKCMFCGEEFEDGYDHNCTHGYLCGICGVSHSGGHTCEE